MDLKLSDMNRDQIQAVVKVLDKKGVFEKHNLPDITLDAFYIHMFVTLNKLLDEGIDKNDSTVMIIEVAVPTQVAKSYNKVRDQFYEKMMAIFSEDNPFNKKEFSKDLLRVAESAFFMAGIRALGQEAIKRMDLLMDDLNQSMGDDQGGNQ
jgi:hypothetical protein